MTQPDVTFRLPHLKTRGQRPDREATATVTHERQQREENTKEAQRPGA